MNTKRLKDLRKQTGFNQKKVAQDLKLGYQRYNHYETGRSEPDNKILQEIAEYYNVTTDYLLGLENTTPPQNIKPAEKIQTDEQQLIEAYRKLSAGQKKGLLQMLEIDQAENKADKKIL